MVSRSPLRETDANQQQRPADIGEDGVLRGGLITKKRTLERIELQERKKFKAERARSIEGAVKVSKSTAIKNIEPKVTPTELLEWQNNWKRIMRRESRIYFDTADESESSKHVKSKMDKKRDLLKSGFVSLGAQITQFFDCNVTIVITRRPIDNIHLLPDSDVLSRAKKSYMKVWGYEKAFRFLKNLDVELDDLEKNKASLAAPSLSNLLQNEKLYGPTDRDPRTRRDDIHYFKFPHVYMFDLWQTWAPIITLEWKPQELKDLKKLPHPVLKMGTFGRCPFIGDGNCDETSYRRVVKRYARDKSNKNYALKLRRMYQFSAQPDIHQKDVIMIPHTCLDSKRCYDKWKAAVAEESGEEEQISIVSCKESSKTLEIKQEPSVEMREPPPETRKPAAAPMGLARQETEEFPDDLCDNSKKKSRVTQEIKASGAHQSNDVATSFGNGLGPTTASVMNKNLKTLSRLVVDRRLASKPANTPSLAAQGTDAVPRQTTVILDEHTKKRKAPETAPKTRVPQPLKKEVARNAGYCENCRVKYESLDDHILTEKHQLFAQNDFNFEMIDSLIEKLRFQF